MSLTFTTTLQFLWTKYPIGLGTGIQRLRGFIEVSRSYNKQKNKLSLILRIDRLVDLLSPTCTLRPINLNTRSFLGLLRKTPQNPTRFLNPNWKTWQNFSPGFMGGNPMAYGR